MTIKNHRLFENDKPVSYIRSPNSNRGNVPEILIIHYTATSDAERAINWIKNRRSRVSAHLVIDRDGSITQMVPFNRIAWHAGISRWHEMTNLNNYSIGIELVNAGKLIDQQGIWKTWYGETIEESSVIVAKHKNDTIENGWDVFPSVQIEKALEVAHTIVERYRISKILGHDEVAPFRKSDPGPAFPMLHFRSRLLGRKDWEAAVYQTTANLNIRVGPGGRYGKLSESPLPKGTTVDILKLHQVWRFVDVIDEVQGESGLQGWVHGNFLKRSASAIL